MTDSTPLHFLYFTILFFHYTHYPMSHSFSLLPFSYFSSFSCSFLLDFLLLLYFPFPSTFLVVRYHTLHGVWVRGNQENNREAPRHPGNILYSTLLYSVFHCSSLVQSTLCHNTPQSSALLYSALFYCIVTIKRLLITLFRAARNSAYLS
jgi:hypothetical protein